ncbi:MAG: hypothetical protein R3F20_11105 [Planctomycetota bacterium]
MTDPRDDLDDLPDALRRDLARLGAAAPPPGEEIGRAIRLRGALVLRERRRRRFVRRVGGFAAAGILGIVFATAFLTSGRETRLGERAASDARRADLRPGDLDGNGRVDVRDARRLALALRDGGASGLADANEDGRVDGDDLEWILARSVSLEGR